jgi:hypothetical protein
MKTEKIIRMKVNAKFKQQQQQHTRRIIHREKFTSGQQSSRALKNTSIFVEFVIY